MQLLGNWRMGRWSISLVWKCRLQLMSLLICSELMTKASLGMLIPLAAWLAICTTLPTFSLHLPFLLLPALSVFFQLIQWYLSLPESASHLKAEANPSLHWHLQGIRMTATSMRLMACSSSRKHRDRNGGIGCVHNRRERNGMKLGCTYYLSCRK